jgi:hypothetical protein
MSKRDRRSSGKPKVREVTSETRRFAKLMLGDAIPYEVGMMRAIHKKLVAGGLSQFCANVLIEAFHMHARNLIEYFKNDKQCAIDPRAFTRKDYTIQGDFIPKTLESKISQQIAHLTHERTDVAKLKLGIEERQQTLDHLEKQIARFEKALEPAWADVWREGLKKMNFDEGAPMTHEIAKGFTGGPPPMSINVSPIASPGASSHPTALGPGAETERPPEASTSENTDD